MKFPRRSETPAHDEARTNRLLNAMDGPGTYRADPDAPGFDEPLSEFEEVVLFGVANDPGQPYPPAGHTYPKRGA